MKPEKNMDVIGKLGINPVENPGVFIESKQNQKFLMDCHPPLCDEPSACLEKLVVDMKVEHEEVLGMQKEMLENAKTMDNINLARIQQLHQEHLNLRLRFIESSNFMIECDSKRKQAEDKIEQEKNIQKQMKVVNRKYTNDLKDLTQFRDNLSETVKQLEPYETIINEVIASDDSFNSVKDCTDRCDALMMILDKVSELRIEKTKQIEIKTIEFKTMCDLAGATVLQLINNLSQLERDLNQVHTECLKWEKVLVNVKNCMVEENITKQRIIDAVAVMYRDLCNRNEIEERSATFEKQMEYIRDEIKILQQVYNQCLKKCKA